MDLIAFADGAFSLARPRASLRNSPPASLTAMNTGQFRLMSVIPGMCNVLRDLTLQRARRSHRYEAHCLRGSGAGVSHEHLIERPRDLRVAALSGKHTPEPKRLGQALTEVCGFDACPSGERFVARLSAATVVATVRGDYVRAACGAPRFCSVRGLVPGPAFMRRACAGRGLL